MAHATTPQTLVQGTQERPNVDLLIDSNVDISTALEAGDTVQSVTLTQGMRVAPLAQTTSTQDGIYEVNASGAATRVSDVPVGLAAAGIHFYVTRGTHAGKRCTITNSPGSDVVGTNGLTYQTGTPAGGLSQSDIDTWAELNAIVADATIMKQDAMDTVAELNAILTDGNVVVSDGSQAITGMQEALGLNFTDATELTIATGAVTATQSLHLIDTESDASTDDLATITPAKGAGDFLIIFPASGARTVVIKNGTGNILSSSNSDITLDEAYKGCILIRKDGTNWVAFDVYSGGGGGLSNVVEDTTPQLGGALDLNGQKINDSNGNEMFEFTETALAVNHLKWKNEATGSDPGATATGGDPNIGVNFIPKGTGKLQENGKSVALSDATRAITGIQEMLGLNLTDATELTIASGAVTVTQGFHTIDTESDAASDDLDTITVAGGAGDVLFVCPANSARTVVIKHGTGNIKCVGNADITLDDDHDFAILIRRDGTNWMAVSRNNSSGGDLVDDTTPQLGGNLDAQGNDLTNFGFLEHANATDLTIASGAITVTQSVHYVDTESSASTDDLDTINGAGQSAFVFLKPKSQSRTIVIKNGTDNIECIGGSDISLENRHEIAFILWNGVTYSAAKLGAGTGGSASDSFKTISVSGQTDVVADSSTDTLTAAEGGDTVITTAAGTDTVTWHTAPKNYLVNTQFCSPFDTGYAARSLNPELTDRAILTNWNAECDGGGFDVTVWNKDGTEPEPVPQGAAFYVELNNDDGAAQGILVQQMVSHTDTVELQGEKARFSLEARGSGTGTLKVAVFEWTGSINDPSLLVSSWSSNVPTFNTTTLSKLAESSGSWDSASWTEINVDVTVGSAATNLIVAAWVEGLADTADLHLSKAQLHVGQFARRYSSSEDAAWLRSRGRCIIKDEATATVPLDLDFRRYELTQGGNRTVQFKRGRYGQFFELLLGSDGTGRTATLSGTFKWPASTAPTQTATANQFDSYLFTWISDDPATSTLEGRDGGRDFDYS